MSSIICRAFQGIGASGLYSLAQVVLFEVGPTHKPSLLGALIGITLAVSFVLGPVLGGVISSQLTWRWIFWIKYRHIHCRTQISANYSSQCPIWLCVTWSTVVYMATKCRPGTEIISVGRRAKS